jgi:hypothetical protein
MENVSNARLTQRCPQVEGVLASRHGESTAAILGDYPTRTEEDLRAVIRVRRSVRELPAPSPIAPEIKFA